MQKFEIRYYLTEVAYKSGIPAFKETITANRNYVVNWANNRLKNSKFKYFDITEL